MPTSKQFLDPPQCFVQAVYRVIHVRPDLGGTPITIVSRQLGHESIQITVDLYTDVDRTSSRQAADFMDTMLN
ncbi:integrase [Mycobacterium frederiksbergense]|uniref:Integrase n=1 Tax=Mycolicibacterium frederiksbergense TaxID=117567 RepID=A0ABT6LAL2_9MYCO|nr:hypothetical protein [Mycolicibacterium frederiksbergense]MDH6199277.1 integrase [Mycolicibacterium frederiksbergense]